MSNRHQLANLIAERIQLASSKTCQLLAPPGAQHEERRKTLEDCGLAIALAMASLADLKAASHASLGVAARDASYTWQCMEAAVRKVTGEPPVTVVAPPVFPTRSRPMLD